MSPAVQTVLSLVWLSIGITALLGGTVDQKAAPASFGFGILLTMLGVFILSHVQVV